VTPAYRRLSFFISESSGGTNPEVDAAVAIRLRVNHVGASVWKRLLERTTWF
jgi:hypothetical protein